MAINNLETLFENSLDTENLSDKQKAVLRASLALFADKGFDRTSSSDIAQLAGVSEGTVFKRFKTKNGIMQALLSPFIQQVLPMAIDEFVSSVGENQFATFKDFLDYVVYDRIKFGFENGKQAKIFLQELLRNREVQKHMASKLAVVRDGVIGQQLKKFQAKGEIVDWNITRVFRYLVSTMVGYVLPPLINEDVAKNFDPEKAGHECVEFLLKALTPS